MTPFRGRRRSSKASASFFCIFLLAVQFAGLGRSRSPCAHNDTSPFLELVLDEDGGPRYAYKRAAGHADCGSPGKSQTMCSLGRVERFPTGNVLAEGVVAAALQARAYRNEVIVLYSSSNDDAVAMVMHFVFRLRELGLDHWLVLMDAPAGCRRLVELLPDGGCVYVTMRDFQRGWADALGGWFATTLAARSAAEYVQPWWEDTKRWTGHSRWLLMTRIAQLGVNMLMSDSDVYFAADPYAALKHPALARHHMIVQAESFHSPGANTGGLYIQGYDPRGAVPWILSQVPYRSLRWVEARFRNPLAPCAKVDLFEQGIFNDALCSAASGELVFMWSLVFASSLYGCTGPRGASGASVLRRSHRKCPRVVDARASSRLGTWTSSAVQASQLRHLVAVPRESSLIHTALQLPTLPEWPPGLPFYPPAEGPATAWLGRWLRSEGLHMHDEAAHSSAAATNETLLMAPRWLMSRWHEPARTRSGGSFGWWSPSVQPPRAFVQHMVMLTWPAYPVRKLAMHVLGWWRYEVDKLMAEPSYMRFCSTAKFFALAPGLAMKLSLRTMIPAWTSMLFLATLAGRTVVWPLQSCSDRILQHGAHCFQGVCNTRVFARGADDRLQCQPAQIGYGKGPGGAWEACSDYGLNTPQLDHFLGPSAHEEHAPAAPNTLWFGEYQRLLATTAANTGARDAVHPLSSMDEFAAELARAGDGAGAVLWLGKPLALSPSAIDALSGAHRRLWRECQQKLRCAYSVQLPSHARTRIST